MSTNRLKQILRDQRGFTIVEVLVVLSIASLIALIVFMAVPQLQRTSRNNQRNSDAQKILTAVNECLVNNNGILTNSSDATLSCLPTGAAAGYIEAVNSTNIASPTTGYTNPVVGSSGTLDMTKISQLGTSVRLYNSPNSTSSVPADSTSAYIFGGYTCSGSSATGGSGSTVSSNQFVILYNREGGGGTLLPSCLSPQ